jgi:hypothetical protein
MLNGLCAQAQGLGCLLLTKALERGQDQGSAQILGQPLDRIADRPGDFIGAGSILDARVMHLRHKSGEAGDPAQPAAAAIASEIRRDAEKPRRNLASPETLARAPGKGEGLQRDLLGVSGIRQETDKVTTEARIPFLEETPPSRLIGTSGQNLGFALVHRE